MGDVYYNSIDFDSEESLETIPSIKPYMDPWDLENYAYIRQHLDSTDISPDLSISNSGDFNAEINSTSFYYVPGVKRIPDTINQPFNDRDYKEKDRDYVAIDEITIHDDYKINNNNNNNNYNEDSDLEDYIPNGGNSLYGWHHYQQQPAVLPRVSSHNRNTNFSYIDNGEDIYGIKQEIYSRLEDHNGPLYDHIKIQRKKPPNFGLSNYGHLKIDYSYSWNNLNKYICN